MPYTQHYFVRNEYFGSVERTKISVRTQIAPPHGKAFFCPICAELWAVCPVDGQATQAITRFCERHKAGDSVGGWSSGHVSRYDFPGSLWLEWEPEWNQALPLALLERELMLNYLGK